MIARPKSVTIICWIFIVADTFTLISFLTGHMNDPKVIEVLSHNPLPVPVQLTITCITVFLTLACQIAMLFGKNWGRLAYTGVNIINILISAITIPEKIMVLPGILIFAVVTFFLFRPEANTYFTSTNDRRSDAKSI